MAAQELIDDHVSLAQCKKAVEALHKHATQKEEERQEKELLPGKEQNIWLNVSVKKINASQKFKPVKIPIKYPLVDPRTSGVCLIVKDPQREYKDLLESHGIKFISRVVGISKLKGKFKPYEARRALLKENSLFLVDDRVVEMMPQLLGVKWFKAKKQPIPVSLKRKDLKAELERAISSTYMNQNKGSCTAIRIANLSHTPPQILSNLQLALPAVVQGIPGGWDNIQNFGIKTDASVNLPIWNCDLNDQPNGLKVDGDEGSDEEDDKMELDNPPAKAKVSKRRTTEEDDEAAKPRKKAKGAEGKVEEAKPKSTSEPKRSAAKKSKVTETPATVTESTASESKAETSSADKKSRKQKNKPAAEPELPTVQAVLTAIETPVEAVVDGPKKRKKAARATAAELMEEGPPAPAPTPAEPAPEPVNKSKKDKKKKAAKIAKPTEEAVTVEVPPPTIVEVKDSTRQGEKRGKKTANPETPAPPFNNKKAKKTALVNETSTEEAPPAEEKATKKTKAGDKKKGKVTAKSKKASAKDALLGRKAGQD